MCIEITSWLRAYFALELRAQDLRGESFVAIARVFEMSRAPESAAELWQTLLARCVELHAQGKPLPSAETWDALFAQLGSTKDSHVR